MTAENIIPVFDPNDPSGFGRSLVEIMHWEGTDGIFDTGDLVGKSGDIRLSGGSLKYTDYFVKDGRIDNFVINLEIDGYQNKIELSDTNGNGHFEKIERTILMSNGDSYSILLQDLTDETGYYDGVYILFNDNTPEGPTEWLDNFWNNRQIGFFLAEGDRNQPGYDQIQKIESTNWWIDAIGEMTSFPSGDSYIPMNVDLEDLYKRLSQAYNKTPTLPGESPKNG